MITTHRSNLEARCTERGYTLAEVAACIVAEDGETITVDPDHPAYPRETRAGAAAPLPTAGPGTELKAILARVGIVATDSCPCNARAAEMDANGCEWVEANLDTVVGWLREQATARGLPFLDVAGRVLVRRAVRNARRASTLSGGSLDQPAGGS
jgi:hypothetical protein